MRLPMESKSGTSHHVVCSDHLPIWHRDPRCSLACGHFVPLQRRKPGNDCQRSSRWVNQVCTPVEAIRVIACDL
jgi:hypothetical protein